MSSVQPWETLSTCFVVDFERPDFVSAGSQIFDLGKDDATIAPRSSAHSTITSVSSDENFNDQFSSSVKLSASYMCFSGSASMGINKESSMSKHTMRTDVKTVSIKHRVNGSTKFQIEPETFLNADLQKYIADGDISMDKLEDALGHFYCSACDLGGIFKRSYIVEKSEQDTKESMRAALEATYGGSLLSASAEASVGVKTSQHNANASMRIEQQILGGEPSIWLGANATNAEELQAEWANTVTDSNLYPFGMTLNMSWELVEALNPTFGAEYKQYLQAKWATQSISGMPSDYVDEQGSPPDFFLRNGNGDYLAVAGNNLSNQLCVWSKRPSERGQQWTWEGKHIRSKLGAKYLAVSGNSGSRGTEIILWDKNEEEEGQKWELKPDQRLHNEKGFVLAVIGNGGPGTRLCHWSPEEEGGQRWEQENV